MQYKMSNVVTNLRLKLKEATSRQDEDQDSISKTQSKLYSRNNDMVHDLAMTRFDLAV